MNNEIKAIIKSHNNDHILEFSYLSYLKAKEVINYHKSFPQYKKTPLVILNSLANHLGLNNIYVKDESYRFGLILEVHTQSLKLLQTN